MTTGDFGNLFHVIRNDIRHFRKVFIAGFYPLEEDIIVFRTAAGYRIGMRVQCAFAISRKRFFIHHVFEYIGIHHFDFLDLVRSTESIKEMHERNACLDCGQMGNACQVHRFLYGMRTKHADTGLTASIDIFVIAEDI